MANAVEASWNGHDYQSRYFWHMAAALRDDDQSHVLEVTYEGDGPKGFDDVIVRYRPPGRVTSSHPPHVSADYHQLKFHATQSGRFGYEDLVKPKFIGAESVSILQRLKDAKAEAGDAGFALVTTDRISDGDPLNELISNVDNTLRLDKLFTGGGDASRMGKVRKLWSEHLSLTTDDELRAVLTGFRIKQHSVSFEDMRNEVNLRFRSVGLMTCTNTTGFTFDSVARDLKRQKRNSLTREAFEQLVTEEGWVRKAAEAPTLNVSIQSFGDILADHLDAAAENTLRLVEHFDGRHLRDGDSWAGTIQPAVSAFLTQMRAKNSRLRLYLDAHTSVAFLAGSTLGLKSGVTVELIQKGRRGSSSWQADDERTGPTANVTTEDIGTGAEIAVAVGLSRDVSQDVREYLAKLPAVGKLVNITPAAGPGQTAIAGGAHAADIADQVSSAVRRIKRPAGTPVHIFIAAPNAFTFFLGQHRYAMRPCVVYEFDFNNTATGSYQPAFRME